VVETWSLWYNYFEVLALFKVKKNEGQAAHLCNRLNKLIGGEGLDTVGWYELGKKPHVTVELLRECLSMSKGTAICEEGSRGRRERRERRRERRRGRGSISI